MKAQFVRDHSHDRSVLSDVVPLSSPLSITVLAASICNLKCKYCVHGSGAPWLKEIQDKGVFFRLETAKQMIDGLKRSCENGFPKLRRITYAGYGEPLLNPELPEIIAYTKRSDVAEEVVVVTNAAALTPALSDRLIEAGLDLLRVSIQGITAEEYLEQSGRAVDIDQLVYSLRYYFEHKAVNQRLYVKIMEEQMKTAEEKQRFLEMFGDACDEIAFESLAPVLANASAEDAAQFEKGINTDSVAKVKLCPLPFYSLHVLTNGTVASCCYYDHAGFFGAVSEKSIQEIWESQEYVGFLRGMLASVKQGGAVCGGCKAYAYTMRGEDSLDRALEKLCGALGV